MLHTLDEALLVQHPQIGQLESDLQATKEARQLTQEVGTATVDRGENLWHGCALLWLSALQISRIANCDQDKMGGKMSIPWWFRHWCEKRIGVWRFGMAISGTLMNPSAWSQT